MHVQQLVEAGAIPVGAPGIGEHEVQPQLLEAGVGQADVVEPPGQALVGVGQVVGEEDVALGVGVGVADVQGVEEGGADGGLRADVDGGVAHHGPARPRVPPPGPDVQ